jgi:hypothetical protein
MVCSSDGQDDFEVLDENPTNYYLMRLRSPCACWNGCKTPEPTTAGTVFFFLYKTIK